MKVAKLVAATVLASTFVLPTALPAFADANDHPQPPGLAK